MALLPPFYLDAVVALGVVNENQQVRYTASGFLYGHRTNDVDENGSALYAVFLVTNRHVVAETTDYLVRFNRFEGGETKTYLLAAKADDGSPMWTFHNDPMVDVAVTPINVNSLKNDGINYGFVESDKHAFTKREVQANGLSEGDGIFALGFPLGQVGDERNYTIVRQGIVARVQDWLNGQASSFLIDASIFPGNSGGPVFLRPEAVSIEGTNANQHCGLLGMVSSYLPYREVAVSLQTGRERMAFEENSGLGVVVPYDAIVETVKAANPNLPYPLR